MAGLRKLYRSHVPTSFTEKAILALDASVRSIADPRRADLVGVVGETTGAPALRRMRDRMRANAVGAQILLERPRIRAETVSAHALAAMPGGSFGQAYHTYCERHRFDPDDRSDVRFVDEEELAYVMTRYRETHDFWHVLFALPPTVLGEVALKLVEAVQTGLPMCAAGALFGGARVRFAQSAQLLRVMPWAARAGLGASDLMCVRYEEHLAEPIDALRSRLRIEPCPPELGGTGL
ncbi:ubiquinone biosynthesis protein COQ4 [Pavlovales sp. CCMP2436]|nr:ubiquinone biosynthesis protein COQ4 [Pavlovales sp. CCMP2436]|mmetsp:Transcript_35298/g.88036  ORF Transcript_35298/g.88036 Transcript_35298/m.88036 type:complete len:236 (-) Transcript_35298:172-879(-)